MNYRLELEIEGSKEKVASLFADPENMKLWQEGFVSREQIIGTPGEEGSKAKLTYNMGKRKIEMIETVTKSNLPDELIGTYETDKVWNEVATTFKTSSAGRTLLVSDVTFKFSGFMKVIGFLMPGAFKKQSEKYMTDFKKFAEADPSA